MSLAFYFIYLFIYLFVYLFIYLFIFIFVMRLNFILVYLHKQLGEVSDPFKGTVLVDCFTVYM